MAEPARKHKEIEPDIRPHFGVIEGGGQSTPDRASLKAVNDQESNIKNPSDDSDDIKSAEESPNKSWKTSYTGANAGSGKSTGFMAAAKKKSPIIAIILTLFGGGIGLVGLSGPALLSQSILANLVQKFNIQETSATIRANKMIASKMSNELTSGVCDIITIACRFSRPSNRFLSELEKNGIKAFNQNGIIESGGLFPNARPDVYQFTNEAGESTYIQASELKDKLINNPELRDAFHKSSKTRFMSLADSIFDGIKARFGFSTNNKFIDVTTDNTAAIDDTATVDGDSASNNLDDVVDANVTVDDGGIGTTADALNASVDTGVDVGVAAGSDVLEATAGNELTNVATDAVIEATEKVAQNNNGDTVSLAAGIICGIADVPGMMTKAVRGFQMAQLVKYSALFLATFGAIKAGDATPENMSTVGNVLTQTVNGKSAMDSFGMRYAMSGDTIPQDDKYKKFAPGASIIAALGATAALANSNWKKSSCSTLSNPLTGVAINSALTIGGGATFGATAAAAGLNIVTAMALGEIIQKVAPPIISWVMSVIPIKDILGYFVGDLTKGLSGENVGDALVSGASHIMGQTANSGGNMPLTVNQAIAYSETTKQVQLAYAEEDRATESPFDISSPNTMLGSIVQQITPYLTTSDSIGSASSTLATIGKIVTGSFGTVLKPLTANATSGDEYKLCNDPEMKEFDIAAGPYCNIMYGVPPEYLDKDPILVVKDLVASGDINEDSGDVISGSNLDKWMNLCMGGDTFEARNCKIDDKTADYALYTIDQRTQKSMDEEPQTNNSTQTGGSSVGDSEQPADTKAINKGWTLKNSVDYSGVQCAEGSTDKSIYTHPTKHFTIRLCDTKLGKVSSLISQRVVDMVNAAKKDGVNLAGSSWRSYEAQQQLRADNCSRGHCSPPTATPGNSQHERGIGTDFGAADKGGEVWNWLEVNGAKYGYHNLPSENWHWSMSGG